MNGVGQVDLLFLNLLMEFKMKYKTFKKSINNLFNFYISTRNFDKDLEKVFGGDSMIMTDWWNIPLEEGRPFGCILRHTLGPHGHAR